MFNFTMNRSQSVSSAVYAKIEEILLLAGLQDREQFKHVVLHPNIPSMMVNKEIEWTERWGASIRFILSFSDDNKLTEVKIYSHERTEISQDVIDDYNSRLAQILQSS